MSQLLPNDPAANTNQRAPGLSLPGVYPYVDFFQGRSGSWWRTDETPGNLGHARGHVSGTYHEQTPLSGTTALTVNTHSHYIGAGSTATSDGNHDSKLGGSHVNRVGMDHYGEHAGDLMHAIGVDVIHAAGGIHFQHATGGTQVTSSGDHSSDHNDGNHHINVAQDHITYIGGVRYESVGTDKGTHVPNGNFDINVSNNYNVQSNTKTTFKVGNSLITILPSSTVIQVGKSTVTIQTDSIVAHDGNGNEMGMNASKLWLGPTSGTTNVFLGGNGTSGTYSIVVTESGPALNVLARIG